MDKFANCFVRNPDGTWFCRAPIHIIGPNGPVTTTPGTSFRPGKLLNGYDIGAWLEAWNETGRAPLNVQFHPA